MFTKILSPPSDRPSTSRNWLCFRTFDGMTPINLRAFAFPEEFKVISFSPKGIWREAAEDVEKAYFNLNFFNRIGSTDMWCNHTERWLRNADLSFSSVSPDRAERCNMGAINYGHTFSLRCCIVFLYRSDCDWSILCKGNSLSGVFLVSIIELFSCQENSIGIL